MLEIFLESWLTNLYQIVQTALANGGYVGLFFACCLAASIVPFPSEAVFILCITNLDPVYCIIWATLGNTLGGLTLYWMGSLGKVEWLVKYAHIDYNRVRRIKFWLRHKGAPIAFLSFLPGMGQVIVIALGLMRCNWIKVMLFMCLGKGTRYIVVAIITLTAMHFT